MGNVMNSLFNSFECTSQCSIHHELTTDIKDVKFCDLQLYQNEIKILNKIIKKDTIKKKKSMSS